MLLVSPPVAGVVLIVAIVGLQKKRATTPTAVEPYDPEPFIADLTQRLRHPWKRAFRNLLPR